MKHALTVILTIACLLSGYGFYKMNMNDTISAIAFTAGLLGIMMSVLRNR